MKLDNVRDAHILEPGKSETLSKPWHLGLFSIWASGCIFYKTHEVAALLKNKLAFSLSHQKWKGGGRDGALWIKEEVKGSCCEWSSLDLPILSLRASTSWQCYAQGNHWDEKKKTNGPSLGTKHVAPCRKDAPFISQCRPRTQLLRATEMEWGF